jgi:hypothetical protein
MVEGALTNENTQDMNTIKIVLELKAAHQTLLNHQKNHCTLQATHLENIASALVQFRYPNIQDSSLAHQDNKVLQQLKKLQFREKVRNMHRKILRMLSPKTQLGIDCIDILDSSVLVQNIGDPNQPKTWKGPWKTPRNPEKNSTGNQTSNIA